MYIGYINGKFSRIFYPEDIKLPIALIIVSDISYGVICYILLFLLRGRFDFSYYLKSVILPEAIYTIVITIFIYPLILKINQLLEAREKRSAHKFVWWNKRQNFKYYYKQIDYFNYSFYDIWRNLNISLLWFTNCARWRIS